MDAALDLVVQWAGGDHTPRWVKKNRVGQRRWGTDADVVELVAVLAPFATGCAITAGLLPIARASAPSAARSPWRKRPRPSR